MSVFPGPKERGALELGPRYVVCIGEGDLSDYFFRGPVTDISDPDPMFAHVF